jgi:hypothetical protein
MRTEKDVTQDLQRTATIKKQYEKQLDDLKKIQDEDSVEIARLISATARGIRRIDKRQKDLNKELKNFIDKGNRE